MEDGIREHHGCSCRDRVTSAPALAKVSERDGTIIVQAHDLELTEWQARYFAAKIYRIARRIRARRLATEE
jgi:hypothetical protein